MIDQWTLGVHDKPISAGEYDNMFCPCFSKIQTDFRMQETDENRRVSLGQCTYSGLSYAVTGRALSKIFLYFTLINGQQLNHQKLLLISLISFWEHSRCRFGNHSTVIYLLLLQWRLINQTLQNKQYIHIYIYYIYHIHWSILDPSGVVPMKSPQFFISKKGTSCCWRPTHRPAVPPSSVHPMG